MVNTIKINCSEAAYVDKYHSYVNFSKSSNLIAGIINNRNLGVNLYKTILNFKLSDITPDSVKSAYIFIFVENMKYSGNTPSNIGICGNYEHIDIPVLNWTSFPNEGSTEILNLSMPRNSTGSYIKINVTSILKELSKFDINYNFIFTPTSVNSSMIIKLGSCNCSNPPYLKLELFEDDPIYEHTKREIDDNFSTEEDNLDLNEKDEMLPGSSDIIFQNNISDNIDAPENNSKNSYDIEYSDDIKKEDINYRNKDMLNVYDKVLDIPTLFTEVLNTLAYQSELLDNLKIPDNKEDFDNMFSNISGKLNSVNEEILNLYNELSTKSSSKDIVLTNTMIEKLNQKLESQTSIINSIKVITSDNSLTEDIEKTNDLILTLSDNIESLYTILNEIKEISSANSTSEEITALNSIMTLLVSSLEIQNSDISSLKEFIENTCTKTDASDINSSITELNTIFSNQTSLINSINETLGRTCSTDDLNSTNNFISNLSGNIDSLYEIANSIKETALNIPTCENIDDINKLISNIQNTINEQNSQLEDIKYKFTGIISKNDIENTNALIINLNKLIDNNNSNVDELNNTVSILKSDFINQMKDNSSLISSLKDICSKNIEIGNLEELITSSITNSFLSQNSIISSINENFSKLCNSDDVSALKENLIYLQNNLDNSSVEFKSYTKLNESYYKSITQSLEKFDAKLSSFEAINKKLDLFENNSTLLSNNFLDLNKEVEKLKNVVIPVSQNLELLQSDFNELKDTILTSYSAKNDNSVPSDTSEINSINERLNIICENIQKVMDVISTITIEPLD